MRTISYSTGASVPSLHWTLGPLSAPASCQIRTTSHSVTLAPVHGLCHTQRHLPSGPSSTVRKPTFTRVCRAPPTPLLCDLLTLRPTPSLSLPHALDISSHRDTHSHEHPPCPLSQVTAVVQELSLQLGLTPLAAAQFAVRQPSLLCSPRARLASNINCLVSTFKLDPPALLQLIEAMPQLLVASPGPLSTNVRFFHKVMRYSPAWSVQLPKLVSSPHNLAVALSFDSSRFHRLQYLVMTGRDRGIGYKSALSMLAADFSEMYPGYELWRHEWGRGPPPLAARVQQQHMQ